MRNSGKELWRTRSNMLKHRWRSAWTSSGRWMASHAVRSAFSIWITLIMIGGGRHEFIVTVETSTAIHNLLGSQEEEDEFVEITVGGQACEFPQQYIVSLELVESALRQLVTDTSAELHWEIIGK
ncbi:hypothetical protein [Paenibacillus lautus]|uniref:hypothetical protein n=1 Tax=Paenibacillus lautus TaxID=1401 RepID=UPI001BCD1B57|nr:hypothetical protein [Paenibacillus lautus]